MAQLIDWSFSDTSILIDSVRRTLADIVLRAAPDDLWKITHSGIVLLLSSKLGWDGLLPSSWNGLISTSLFNTSCINFTMGDHTQHRPTYPISPKAGSTSPLKTILVSADTCKRTPGLASNLLLLRFQQWFMVCKKRIAFSTQIHTEYLRIKHVFVTIFCICSFLILPRRKAFCSGVAGLPFKAKLFLDSREGQTQTKRYNLHLSINLRLDLKLIGTLLTPTPVFCQRLTSHCPLPKWALIRCWSSQRLAKHCQGGRLVERLRQGLHLWPRIAVTWLEAGRIGGGG